MLIETLKQLVENNLVDRKDFKTIPQHVEYEITKNGKQALEAIPIFAEALST